MPHYKDGSAAEVGDLVKGRSYNDGKKGIVGTVIKITPGAEICNCVVAYVDAQPLQLEDSIPVLQPPIGPGHIFYMGEWCLTPKFDYGETSAFEKVVL